MKDAAPKAILLSDYTPPAYWVDHVDLHFELDPNETRVRSTLRLRRNPEGPSSSDLVLDGAPDAKDSGALLSIALDGQPLAQDRFVLDEESLTVRGVPDLFTLTTERRLKPSENKSLEGLYVSSGNFCTQCEAEGFRKITWFPDRPDVMAPFRVTLVADKARFPVLLSNGNLVESGSSGESGERHFAVWEDPFKKPCYLFALVAGDLVEQRDSFVTQSGRQVDLHVYVEHGNLDKTAHCMESLKKSMRWDEERFGREYDLDIFNIVAVGDFNMGAMENKSLNIFNTKYVLAKPETATDVDFAGIEGVVGHEYFHNWSGNRVTCRDWFQLSLKEGFTVFRDQEFSADVGSRAVKRIEDVLRLRAAQFPEDAGPTAHPVRPDSYVEISNFYTVTIYEKGSEVVRMFHTLLGEELFRRGCDLYFERHDGQAVTTDDFAAAMAEVSGRDLSQFKLWYTQAGTPVVRARGHLDAASKTYTLELSQSVPATPGQPEKAPMLIPVVIALLDADGRELPLRLAGDASTSTERILELSEAQQTFVFEDISGPVVPSLLRGFSAPVKLDAELSDHDLTFLMAHDTDSFNRFEASQVLATRLLLDLVRRAQSGTLHEAPAPDEYLRAFGQALSDERADPALLSLALALPSESVIGDAMAVVDVDAVWAARQHLRRQIAAAHEDLLRTRYASLAVSGPYQFTPDHVGRRALRNLCLAYLSCLESAEPGQSAVQHLAEAGNMTDTMAALACLTDIDGEARERALSDFYARFRTEPLVVDKWFALQAMSHLPGTLERVQALLTHEAFSMENPNKVRALVASFAMGNPLHFHSKDGSGYRFLADRVMELDAFNPQIAARILTPLARWRRQDEGRQALMKAELQRVLGREGVSRDVFEIASKALAI